MGSAIQSMVFLPPDPPSYTEKNPRTVNYIITKSKKRIPCYFIPVHERFQKEDEEIKTTILYSHGNATDIGAMNDFLTLLHDNLPVNILHYEYIGYGLGGLGKYSPSEEFVYESVEAAFQFLLVTKHIDMDDIIIWGTSLGSGPTNELASRHSFKGVILEAGFTSCCRVVNVVKRSKLVTAMMGGVDLFVNINKVDKFSSPTMIIHGKEDSVVPFEHGIEMWNKVPEECKYKNVWVTGADHHDIITTMGSRNYIQMILEFLNFCEKKKRSGGVKKEKKKNKKKKKKKGGGGGGGGMSWMNCGSNEMIEEEDYVDYDY